MPAYTEWISQPAINSASSTARWMDCTVDSMFTTTPRFRPRDGCEPRPTTSILPSLVISPTMATTLEVPISRPTIRLRSFFLGIGQSILSVVRDARGRRIPADRETVAVTQVDVVHRVAARRNHRAGDTQKSFQAAVHVLAS